MWGARCATVLLLVACGKDTGSVLPTPDASPPRPEGQADLDGDGVDDCWRTVERQLIVRPRCEGAGLPVDLGAMAVVLPEELDTPVWARALAGVWSATPTSGARRR
jgi:hypothetical protein